MIRKEMSGSKTERVKNTKKCKYIFVRGKKEGEKCNAICKSDFCKNHNQHRKEYAKKYYSKNNNKITKDNFKEKIRKLKKMVPTKLKSMKYYIYICKSIENACTDLLQKIIGVGLICKPDKFEKIVNERIKKYEATGRKIYKEFQGTEEVAQKEYDKLIKERDRLLRRYERANQIMKIATEKYEKYYEEHGEYPKNYY
jgi:regulator of PEP synthase PpsR (kinase-PPPase family)